MMRRTLSLAMSTLLAAASPGLQALGVGEPRVQSSLSEPLRASITLSDLEGVDPSLLKVRLADETAFEQAGLSRSALAESVRLALSRHDGNATVMLTTEQPVREPYLDLLLTLAWPGGELRRQVTLLFDPPGYASVPALLENRQVASRVQTPQRTVGGERAGPSRERPLSPSESRTRPQQLDVQPGDTLWRLASHVGQGDGASVEQAMLALLQANPEAFPGGNVNELRAGVMLEVPSREAILANDRLQARRQIDQQNQAWQSATDSPAAAEPADETQQRLTLLSDSELAREQGEALLAAAESDSAGADSVALVADALEPAVMDVQARARLDELEANWQASQATLEQVRQERDQLEDEIGALREEMLELRELLTASPMAASAVNAEGGTNGASAGAATPPSTAGSDASGWERFWRAVSDYLLMIGGGSLALLLALLAVLRRRERLQAQEEDEEDDVPSFPQSFMTTRGGLPASSGSSFDSPPGASPRSTPSSAVASTLHQAPQAEVINEADIFIAYGRFEQARGLLEQSLESEPERDDLRLKLLSVYAELGERQSAEGQARLLEARADSSYGPEVRRLMARFDSVPSEASTATPPEPVEPEPAAAKPADPEPVESEPAATVGAVENEPVEQDMSVDEPPAREPDAPVSSQGRIIDYEPPTLDAPPERQHADLRQPSVDYPGHPSDTTAVDKDNKANHESLGEPQWDLEEVAFEPLNLDNERPVTGASRTPS